MTTIGQLSCHTGTIRLLPLCITVILSPLFLNPLVACVLKTVGEFLAVQMKCTTAIKTNLKEIQQKVYGGEKIVKIQMPVSVVHIFTKQFCTVDPRPFPLIPLPSVHFKTWYILFTASFTLWNLVKRTSLACTASNWTVLWRVSHLCQCWCHIPVYRCWRSVPMEQY